MADAATIIIDRGSNVRGRRARAAVVAAATQLFAERGYAGTSIADVAEAAAVAKPSVLYHFPDKDTLWRSCCDALWAEVDAFYVARLPAELVPSRATIRQLALLFVEAALRWPAYVRIPFIEGATPSWRSAWLVDTHFRRHVRTTDHLLRHCGRAGLLRADPQQVQLLLTSGINVIIAQAAMWTTTLGKPVATSDFLDAYVEAAIDLTFRPSTPA